MANILLVHDVESIVSDICETLSSAGHQVLVANSAANGIACLKTTSFDLAICAVHLKKGTAFDLLKFIKEDSLRSQTPFVFFCCEPNTIAKSVSESVRKTASILGADKYISQDTFDGANFIEELQELLPTKSTTEQKRI